ncbi:MAG TPA: M36 family metallopeptidase [Pseudomonadota bacterium]|nr:M36 family metallopeptidase [Pseudomonadota bacterium]
MSRYPLLLAGMSAFQLLAAACSAPPAAPPPAAALPTLQARVAHRDPELGVPTFVWLDSQPDPNSDAQTVAWRVLRQLAPTYGLGPAALQTARLARVHDVGQGAIIAQFEQEVAGLEVFRLGLNVAMNRELEPLGATGYLMPQTSPRSPDFTLRAEDAVAQAIAAMTGTAVQPSSSAPAPAGYQTHTIAAFAAAGTRYSAAAPPRTKKVWFPTRKELVPAYYVELDLSINDQPDSALRSYVVSAIDGKVLFENDLIQNDSYKYRVFADKGPAFTPWDGPHGNNFTPHPTGKRDGTDLTYVASQVVELEHAPFKQNDPWLPAGATAAVGNNATAYADVVAPDGLGTGDIQLKPSAAGEFDYNIDLDKDDPAANSRTIQAVTTNFFFIVNHLHDTYYDAGWDEKSRNPQKDNFGRGGTANDPIKAESQDNSGRNNANASTPADGASPRIQMYLFDPKENALKVTAPADLARNYDTGRASFGPKLFDVKNDLVVVNDGMGASMTDGCETPFTNAAALKDKIAVIDRGTCSFETKAYNAQTNGAKGVIIINNVPGAPIGMASGTPPPPMPVTIPAVMVSQADGAAMTAKLSAGMTVSIALRTVLSNNDSSLDGMIVSHEWGHVLSNRLIGNANGLVNNQGRSMGEGWSDFVALLMTTRAEDATNTANANWNGTFAAAAYSTGPSNNSAYEGIRRYPYSSDMAKNPLTFKHVQNGNALPATPAPAFGLDGSNNAEVHNTGEVWTNVLWECYTALLRDTGRYTFAQASQAMREYLVASLKLTPVSPTMLEARDAVLLAALARSDQDFELFARAFARRGMGVFAVGPARGSADHAGVVESNAVGGVITVDSMTLNDSVLSCDRDGILDNDEVGVLTVTLRNTGTLSFAATGTVSDDTGTVSFPRGNRISFVNAKPYKAASGSILVALRGARPRAGFQLRVKLDAPNLAAPGTVSTVRAFVGNYDLVPASSATDTMDETATLWNKAGDPALDQSGPWALVRDGEGGRWAIPDAAAPSDQWLVSPPLQVSTSGSFGFTLRHRYSFEVDSMNNYDGGVIEISTDDGKTWSDVGKPFTKNGYGGALWVENAPLKGRQAFVGESAGYPAFITTVADFGAAYQGKTVRLRFRVGTDPAAGAAGWELDEVQFSGIDNLPFASRQNNPRCLAPTP